MKKTSLFIVGLSLAMHLQAQKNAEKLALKPGQKFSLQGSDSSATAQKNGRSTYEYDHAHQCPHGI
jgi:hypothetical protein